MQTQAILTFASLFIILANLRASRVARLAPQGSSIIQWGLLLVKDAQTDIRWDKAAQLLRVMAHPTRLMILNALCQRPHCVKDINSLVPIVQAHLSQHMAALRNAGLIDCHISGPLRCYYIIQPSLVKKMLRLLGEDHPIRPRSRDAVMRASQKREPLGTISPSPKVR
ncbi:MAG: winged helix-turn-helix transcriptional regulator [Pirellulaceae bacterium]|nr:winged helix-turn-helix transcriptional regulator [Pirellulaceae bacterium]